MIQLSALIIRLKPPLTAFQKINASIKQEFHGKIGFYILHLIVETVPFVGQKYSAHHNSYVTEF
tara:strand:- start:21 stop:212 length:192 start_codon:yes stop_codon:yes gene_type:complete